MHIFLEKIKCTQKELIDMNNICSRSAWHNSLRKVVETNKMLWNGDNKSACWMTCCRSLVQTCTFLGLGSAYSIYWCHGIQWKGSLYINCNLALKRNVSRLNKLKIDSMLVMLDFDSSWMHFEQHMCCMYYFLPKNTRYICLILLLCLQVKEGMVSFLKKLNFLVGSSLETQLLLILNAQTITINVFCVSWTWLQYRWQESSISVQWSAVYVIQNLNFFICFLYV